MRKKISSFVALFLFIFFWNLINAAAQDMPSNLLSEVPQAAEKLNSADASARAGVLSELIKPVERSCTMEVYLVYKLTREDYVYVIRQILEKDLTALDEKLKPEVWSRLNYLISKYKLTEFAEPIAAYLGEDWTVQAEIINALRNLEAKEFDSKLAPLLDSPQKYIQRLTLETLIGFHSHKAVPALESMLTEENESSQYWAMLQLVEIDGKEAAPKIAAKLKSEYENIPYWALDALVKLNAREQAKDVWQFLKSNTDKKLEGFAIAALLAFDQKEAIPLAIDKIKANIQADENVAVWEFINKIKPKILVPVFISIYNSKERYFENEDQERRFRAAMVRFLLDYKAPEGIPIFRQNLAQRYKGSTIWEPNLDAARVLQELNAGEAIDDLITVFNDCLNPMKGCREKSYSGELAITMAKFGDRKVWKLLIDYVEKTDFYTRDQIIVELNKQLDPQLWKETKAKSIPQIEYGSVKTAAEIAGRETGIPISFEYLPKKETIRCQPLDSGDKEGMPCEFIDGNTSLFNAVNKIVYQLNYDKRGEYTFIFDNGTIRILSVEKAIEWWRNKIIK
jgi:HEAT repeat protein